MKIYNVVTNFGSSFNLVNGYGNNNSIPTNYKICSTSLGDRYKLLREQTKDNKLQDNSVVYFSPFTEFPLYKFKNYLEESKLNITRSTKYNNINTVVLNDNIIKKYFSINNKNHYNFAKHYILDKKFYNNNVKPLMPNIQYSREINLETNQDNILFSDKLLSNVKTKIKLDIEKLPTIEGYIIASEWGSNKPFQYFDLFEKIINDYEQGNINIVFDDQINNEVNNGLEFDEDLFSTVLDMVANNDEGNINIAREIIASTNLDQAKPYVLYLFHLYPQLSKQNNTRSWKYVTDQFKQDKSDICHEYLQLFLNSLGIKYPEYIPTIFELMAIYFNKQWKKEVIKEIKVS